jgi:hypothetical protein
MSGRVATYRFVRHQETVVKTGTATSTLEFGGADRDRTGDPLLAKQVLSQLSYSP